jgi:hypothetical protein
MDLPYVVRVYFDGGRGIARQSGVQRHLQDAPLIDGLPRFTMLDYVPSVVAMIQPHAEKVRDLTVVEQGCVERWLASSKGLW